MSDLKVRILAGGKPEPFAVPALDGDKVQIRPLSVDEAEKVQAAAVRGVKTSQATPAPDDDGEVGRTRRRRSPEDQKVEMDLAEVISGNYEAQCLAAYHGLVDPQLSLEEIRGVRPPQVVEQIGQEVMQRSGLGSQSRGELRRFRAIPGGKDGPEPAPARGPSEQDSG